MLILIAKLSSIRAIDIERKKQINDQKKKIHGVLTYFPKPDLEICFINIKNLPKPKDKKMKIVETVHE